MQNKFAIAVLLGISAASSAQNAAEPYPVQTDVLGETIDAYRLNHQDEKQDCIVNPAADRFAEESTPGLKACTTLAVKQPMTFGDVKVQSRLVRFDDGRLYEAVYTFNSASVSKESYGLYYEQLKTALTTNFGKPSEVQDSNSATPAGTPLQNQTSTWKNGVSTISIKKFVGDLYTTAITFSLDSLEEDARHQIQVTTQHRSEM
jgi:hypothetical protein